MFMDLFEVPAGAELLLHRFTFRRSSVPSATRAIPTITHKATGRPVTGRGSDPQEAADSAFTANRALTPQDAVADDDCLTDCGMVIQSAPPAGMVTCVATACSWPVPPPSWLG